MTHSLTEPAAGSPSMTPPQSPPRTQVTAPPLRVTGQSHTPGPPSSPPTLSETSGLGEGGAGGDFLPPDPVDTSIPSPADPAPGIPAEGSHSLKDLARGMVLAASSRIAAAVARGEDEAAIAALTATEKEQRAIADPLAKVAGRHMKTSAGNPDIADLIVAGIAAVGYAARVITGLWNLKRARAALAAATRDPAETEGASS